MAMRVAIAGGGLLGRLSALQLLQAGCEVSVFEANASGALAPGLARAAAWTAAGMLSPVAEMECGGPLVRDMGMRSLELWCEIDGQLRDALNVSGSPLGLQLRDSLMVCHASDMGSAQRVLRLLDQDPDRMMALDGHAVAALAPMLKGTLHAWRLIGEGHLNPYQAMPALYQATQQARWHFGAQVSAVAPHQVTVNGERHTFDLVLDVRGTGAARDIAVRGVRGEVLVLSAPGFELHRPVRLLHPRWRVYIVPRPDGQLVIGATEIESEDRSPISVQSTMELLSAAFSIFPALAEARILWTDVNLRPAMPDNMPYVEQQSGLIRINGLFRHGWLLAPAVCEQALSHASVH